MKNLLKTAAVAALFFATSCESKTTVTEVDTVKVDTAVVTDSAKTDTVEVKTTTKKDTVKN